MIVIAVISIVVYFVAGAPWKHLAWLGIGGVAAFFALIKVAPYRAARLTVFLNPEIDPQGIGYHINQAILAIGSGGFFGVGLGHSLQKFGYLPEAATDSIFSIIAEELGFMFAAGVVLLFLAFTLQSFRIAKRAPDQFGRLLATGIATWIGFQAFVNIGATCLTSPNVAAILVSLFLCQETRSILGGKFFLARKSILIDGGLSEVMLAKKKSWVGKKKNLGWQKFLRRMLKVVLLYRTVLLY
jgi:cell division protein FtsW (lipid II flippase)